MRSSRIFAGLAVATCLLAAAFAFDVLTTRSRPLRGEYWVTTSDDGYVVATQMHAMSGEHVTIAWSAVWPLDRMLLLTTSELDRMLRGEESFAILQEWPLEPDDGSIRQGTASFVMPDTCRHEPHATYCDGVEVVWVRGEGWKGISFGDMERDELVLDRHTGSAGHGPILFHGVIEGDGLHARAPWWQGGVLAGIAATMAAGAWWAWEARRAGRERRVEPIPMPGGAEEMLRLFRMSELYVETISRYFIVAGAFIVLASGVVMALVLPPLMEALHRTLWLKRGLSEPLFALLVPFAAAVAFAFWFVQYRRVRREVRRWREASSRLERETADLLA